MDGLYSTRLPIGTSYLDKQNIKSILKNLIFEFFIVISS